MTKYFYGQVTTAKIANGAVTEVKLATNAVSYRASSLKSQQGIAISGALGVVNVAFAPAFTVVPSIRVSVETVLAATWTVRITGSNVNGFTCVVERNDAGTATGGATATEAAHTHPATFLIDGGAGGNQVRSGSTTRVFDGSGGNTNVDVTVAAGSLHSHAPGTLATTSAPVGPALVPVHWNASLQE